MRRKQQSCFLAMLNDYFSNYLPFSKGLRNNTLRSYSHSFALLINFMYVTRNLPADKITFQDLNYDTLTAFLNWLEEERNCKPATRNQRLSALMAFSEYAQNRNFDAATAFRNSVSKIPFKKTTSAPRAVFTREEVGILLALPDEHTKTGLRDKVLLSIMYASGARAQEICDLTVRDVRFRDETATLILTGKGGKTRRVGLPSNCVIILKKYLRYRRIENENNRHIFSSQTNEHMTVSCVEGIFKKYVMIAKSKHPDQFPAASYPPHSMRHSTASHLLEAGVDIMTIKNILGHASVQTTEIYAELSQDTVNRRLKQWNQTWFSGVKESVANPAVSCAEDNIPDFLKKW